MRRKLKLCAWNSRLHCIHRTLKFGNKDQKVSLSSHPSLGNFLSLCCQQRHYSFSVKKCGSSSCDICKPHWLPSELLSKIHHITDPNPTADGECRSFLDICRTTTNTEMHRQSLAKRPGRAKTLLFVASVQHMCNVSLIVQCEECEMWHLLYSPWKLSYIKGQEFTRVTSLNGLEHPPACTQWNFRSSHAMLRASGETVLFYELWPNLCVLLFCRQPCVFRWVSSSMSIVQKYTCKKESDFYCFLVYTQLLCLCLVILYVQWLSVMTAKECFYRDFLSNNTNQTIIV